MRKKSNQCKDQEDLAKEDLKDLKKLEKTNIILHTPERYVFFSTRYDIWLFSRYNTILIRYFGLFFLGIYGLTTIFLGEIFDDLFLGIFFDKLFLNKRGRESGGS